MVLKLTLLVLFLPMLCAAQVPLAMTTVPVAQLPSADWAKDKIYGVSDGLNGSDCTQGGGTVYVMCRSNGTVWTAAAGNFTTNITQAVSTVTAPLPSGIIVLSLTTCPATFSELSALSGKFILGTVTANADVGTTGGSNAATPTGSVSAPVFSGTPFSSVINHTHAVNVIDPGHTHLTQRYPTATGASSGFTIDTSMSGTLADNTLPTKTNTTGISATTANPPGSVASITPAGTNTAPTFTGNAISLVPSFIRVVFCQKQ